MSLAKYTTGTAENPIEWVQLKDYEALRSSSDTFQSQRDTLAQQLAQASKERDGWKDKAVKVWGSDFSVFSERDALKKELEDARAALNTVRTILQSDSIEYDDLRNIDQIIESALALKPSDAKEGT